MTYNQIVNEIKTYITNHPQLGADSFFYGSPFDLADLNIKMNHIIIEPIPFPISEQVANYRFRLYCMDIVDSSLDNYMDILNDTQLILNDIVNNLAYGTLREYYINQNNINITPFQEKFDDLTAGNWIEIEFQVPRNNDLCLTPELSYLLTFIVKDIDGNVIQDADIQINNTTLMTDSNGKASIILNNGTYSYTISKDNYNTYEETILINSNTQLEITLQLQNSWAPLIIEDYLSRNTHFDATHEQWTRDTLTILLAMDYEMFDESTGDPLPNYYTTYGPSGLNKTTADWLLLFKKKEVGTFSGIIQGVVAYYPNWDYNGLVVQNQNVGKNDVYGEGYLMITTYSTDEFYINFFYTYTGGFEGNIPNISNINNIYSLPLLNVRHFSNDFDSEYPDTTQSGYIYWYVGNCNFSKLNVPRQTDPSLGHWIVYGFGNTNCTEVVIHEPIKPTGVYNADIRFYTCALPQDQIDNIIEKIWEGYSGTTNSQGLTLLLNGGTNEPPSKEGLKNVYRLIDLHNELGENANIQYNTDWRIDIIDDYLDNNDHFDLDHILWTIDTLWEVLDENYVMYDEDTGVPLTWNYYSEYNTKNDSKWFILFRKESVGTFAGVIGYFGYADYNGNVWYEQGKNDVYGEAYLMITHKGVITNWESIQTRFGGFTGNVQKMYILDAYVAFSTYYNYSNNFNGQLPDDDFGSGSIYYRYDSNNLSGNAPRINGTSLKQIRLYNLYNNNLTGYNRNDWTLGGVRQYFSIANNNITDSDDIDNFLEDLLLSFQAVAPTGNTLILLNGGTNAAPSATGQQHITDIVTIFTNAGYVATITTN